MRRMIKLLTALALSVSMLSTCVPLCVMAEEEEDPVLASAYDGEVTVTLSEAREEFEWSLEYYQVMYSQYGYSMDAYDTSFQQSVAAEAVQYLLSRKIVERHAASIGYVLDEETDKRFLEEAQAQVDTMRENLRAYAGSYGYTEEELEEIVASEMESAGYTVEDIYDTSKLSAELAYISDYASQGAEVTDEEIRASFDQRVVDAQTKYASIDTFITDYLNGEEILYTPEGVRKLHVIFFNKEDATQTDAPDATAAPEDAQGIDGLTGKAKAQAVLDLIHGGMDFDEAMLTYDEDGSSEEVLLRGYPIGEGAQSFGDAFRDGALALAAPGDVSDVIETDYGYFLLRYEEDMVPGAVAFEGREEIEADAALEAKKQSLYSDYVANMLTEANAVFNDFTPLYHVREAQAAYASVVSEAELTGMPEGQAVAMLEAGASLDVLGRIEVSGVEYAFVSVIGTAFKGYIRVDETQELDEASAQAVDNTALSQAVETTQALPTFTIAMNDGSLIYGELYPETAPESVGNFIELANSGFYDGLIFHRVIAGFMIQGGDPLGDGTGGPGYTIKGEFSSNGVTNDLSHTRGVLSMARANDPDSAGSQFFIMHADADYLNGDYAAFGKVINGLDAVDAIASSPTDSADKPMSDQIMRTVYVETYGKTYPFTKLPEQ